MVFMMLNLKLLINLGNQTYVSTHQHDDGGTMIVSFEQDDDGILVTDQCQIRTDNIGAASSNFFTKATRNSILCHDGNDVGWHHGASS